jgi:hypothetical protein
LPHQVGLTVVAPVLPSALDDLRAALNEIGADPAHNELLPFGRLAGTHFARFFLLEPTADLEGRAIPPQLVFMIDWDAPLDDRLHELIATGKAGLDRLFAACEGYRGGGHEATAAYLREHAVPDAAYYVNTVGLGADQVIQEAKLRDSLESHIDEADGLRKRSIAEVRSALVQWVREHPTLSWALQPAAPPDLGWRLRELAHLVVMPLIGLILLPLIIVALPFWLIALRIHENSDPTPDVLPDPRHVAALEAVEDHTPINPFTAVGFIKSGWFRAATTRIVLLLISYGVRHIFNHANLAGVKTIHFARWTFIDGGRRVIFASNYDGSQESYMDDFIDKVAWGLNAVFSNGVGYPPTRWLLFSGARNERAFKHLLRVRQVVSPVWYTPYPSLSALNIGNNSALRAGLLDDLTEPGAGAWLGRL